MKTQHIHAILDRSGSMHGKIKDVIGGFKTNINDLKSSKKVGYDIAVSAKMFDQEEEVLIHTTDVNFLSNEMIDEAMKKYIPRGQTAIRDALGNSLVHFIEKHNNKEFESCIVYVFTDGLENASETFSVPQIRKMVCDAETHNIKVIYVGSNQDSILNAADLGISPGLALDYDECTENINCVYRALSGVAERVRNGIDADFTLPERLASRSVNTVTENSSTEPPPIKRAETKA
jgi:uncharacterized protein YegL